MSNQSCPKEGKQQADDKAHFAAEESQIEPALAPPPPPSLDPSFSASSDHPGSHDPSHLKRASTTPGDPVASQLDQLFSIVSRLCSESEALKAQGDVHSSSIAHLSAESKSLTRTIEDQDRVTAEVSIASIPEGHWVWETEKVELERSRGKEGRWLFSLDKYKQDPPRIATGPPTSLLSLPVELIDIIFSLLPRSDILAVCLVSFGLLQRASAIIYPKQLVFDYGTSEMYRFVSSRASETGRSSGRVSRVLLPRHLFLIHGNPPNKKKVDVASILEGLEGRGQISIDRIVLVPNPINPSSSFRQMLPILSYFNPQELQLGALRPNEEDKVRRRVPTVLPVTKDELAFLWHWTRLEEFVGIGFASVPVLSEHGGTLALLQCLLKGTIRMEVRTRLRTLTSASMSLEPFSIYISSPCSTKRTPRSLSSKRSA